MKRNKCLLIAACVASVLFSGCNYVTTEDGIKSEVYIYNNKLDVPVSVEYYYHNVKNELETKTVNITAGDFIQEVVDYRASSSDNFCMIMCDSVCITFNTQKELWYFLSKERDKAGSIFTTKNYKKIDETKSSVTYEYDFTEAIYNLATDIIE